MKTTKAKTGTKTPKPLVALCPFIIVHSGAEQRPYRFLEICSDVADGSLPVKVNVIRQPMPTADYSILGHTQRVVVERKSKADFYSTLTHGRARFERELQRMEAMEKAVIMVEAEWSEIRDSPPRWRKKRPGGGWEWEESKVPFKTLWRTVIAFMERYRAQWFFAPDRWHAEQCTYRLLERFWKERCQPPVKPS